MDARPRLVTELLKLLPELMRAMHAQCDLQACWEEGEQRLPPGLRHALRHGPPPTQTQVRLAIELAQEGPATIGDLAQRLGVSAPAVSLLVDRMEEHGLIERSRDAHDRRVVWVRLTPAAQAFADAVLGLQRRLMARFLGRIPEAEREAFVRNVAVFARVLGPMTAPPAGPSEGDGGADGDGREGGNGRDGGVEETGLTPRRRGRESAAGEEPTAVRPA